ncbi:MAG: DUF4249 family protein [Hyphomicrobiales bacterium]
MKNINIIISVFFLLFLSSCVEYEEIELNESERKIVVVGEISDGGFAKVDIQKSINYAIGLNYLIGEDSSPIDHISGAKVTISDSKGASEVLVESSKEKGTYYGSIIKGESGNTYNIKVEYEGEIVRGHCFMPNSIDITRLDFEGKFNQTDEWNDDSDETFDYFHNVDIYWNDPKGQDNYYMIGRWIEEEDEELSWNHWYFVLLDDKGKDGSQIKYTYGLNEYRNSKDTLFIEVRSLNRDVYNYLKGIDRISSGADNTLFGTPGNPNSNLEDNNIGVFNAYSKCTKKILKIEEK